MKFPTYFKLQRFYGYIPSEDHPANGEGNKNTHPLVFQIH